ncbi:hypothetical protein GCM10010413_02820 [Promicromonospora sukumoe]|uniref:Uncharacterized protein n=1 Tax=Promicromonospora sukumoe TaxID=88382 RepID=A0A7W3JEV1_9MICO|nr:hypothetical protein [Promicromonospora sukumoe]MBA8811535.1 hypothetical protein [Promicromonospora sukumoe]
MTDQTNDRKNPSEIPGGPEGQDTSENMSEKTPQDPDTTEVLPAQATPPTQQIVLGDLQQTQQVPAASAPEGEVHPAYGVAAARVEAEARAAEARSAEVHDAPVHDDSDPLAALREPARSTSSAPEAPASGSPAPAQPVPGQPGQPGQAVQPAPPAQAAPKRGPRVGTAVWGLVVIAVGLGILAVAAGVVFDLGVALIVLLGAAGVILVAGSVISSVRRR